MSGGVGGSGAGWTASSGLSAAGSSSSGEAATVDDGEAAEGFVLFLAVGLLIGCICRWLVQRMPRVPLPFTVLLLFVGVLMGSIAEYGGDGSNVLKEAILSFADIPPRLGLYIFLPVLIFDSAFNVHFHLFVHSLYAALLLAFPGALIALFFVAVFARYVFDYGWDWSEALMLGAILSSTDPVAVVGLLRDLGSSPALATLIEAESLLNDGSAFVVYLLTQSILIGGDSSTRSIVGSLFQYALGGPAFGLACGLATIWVMNRIYSDAEVEISVTIASVYLTFWLADDPLDISAVLAVVVMGLYMAKHRYAVSPSVQPNLTAVWSLLIFAVNIFIFILSGLIISAKLLNSSASIRGVDVAYLFILYALLHVVRFFSVLIFLPLFRRTNVHLTMREVVMISWSGMRGSVSLLLALTTYLQPAYDQVFRDRLTFQVCGIVLLTLVVNGMTSRYVLQALQLNTGSAESRLVLRSALDHMRKQTSQAMREMRVDPKFAAVEWSVLRPFLPSALISEVQQRDEAMAEEDRAAQVQRRLERRVERRNQSKAQLPLAETERATGGGEGAGLGRSAAEAEEVELRENYDRIFPPSHPIHRMTLHDLSQADTEREAAPGDLTLMNMPTLQFEVEMQRSSAGLPLLQVDEADDEEDGGVGGGRGEPPAVYSATVGGDSRALPPVSRPLPPLNRAVTRPLPAPRSSLMSLFEEPDEVKEAELHPPAGPAAPSAPPPPLRTPPPSTPAGLSVSFQPPPLLRTVTPQLSPRARWPRPMLSSPSRRVLAPLQPPTRVPPLVSARSRRRRYLHARHRQLSSAGELHLMGGEDVAVVDAAKRSLHRELSVRFLTALQADYDRQWAGGLVTRRSLRVLTAACEAGIDQGSLIAHWQFLYRQLRCPRWLSWLYSSSLLSRVDHSTWLRPLRRLAAAWMFSHLKTTVELATAFLSAQQRLEFILDSFPEFSSIDAEVIAAVQKEAGALQSRALSAWADVTEGVSEHSAEGTSFATPLTPLTCPSLSALSSLLPSVGNAERGPHSLSPSPLFMRGCDHSLTLRAVCGAVCVVCPSYHEAGAAVVTRHAAVLLLRFQQSEIRSLHATGMLEQREFDFILALIQSKLLRLERNGLPMQMTDGWDLFQALPFIKALTPSQQRRLKELMEAKAACRATYEPHQILFDRRQRQPGLLVPVRGSMRLLYEMQTDDEEESMEEELRAFKRAQASGDPTTPPPCPSRSATRERDRHRRFHLHESVARGGVIGAFEMLTGHSTLAVCSTVTMAEAFVLDRDCVALLCEEEESCALLCKAAAEAVLKAQWRRWAVPRLTKLSEYQVPRLMERAQVARTPPSALGLGPHSLDLRDSDVLLLLRGTARGRGMKRRVKRARRPLSGPQPQPPPAVAPPPALEAAALPSPLYEGPCWLRRRRGRLELHASALYLTWTLRDEDICTLFPPPPRADMASYARRLGLTMRLAQQHLHSQTSHTHADAGADDAQQPSAHTPGHAEDAAAAAGGGRSETPPPPSSSPGLPPPAAIAPSPSSIHPLLSRSLAPSLSTYMGGTLRRRSVDDGRHSHPHNAAAAAHLPTPFIPALSQAEEAKEGERKWQGGGTAERSSTTAAPAPVAPSTSARVLRRTGTDGRGQIGGVDSGGDSDEDGEEEEDEFEDELEFKDTWPGKRGREAEGDGEGEDAAMGGSSGEAEDVAGSKAAAAFLAVEIETRNARTV